MGKTQREMLVQAVRDLVGGFNRKNILKIEDILGMSQNRKEIGGASDETISADLWTAGNMVLQSAEGLLDSIIQFKRVLVEERVKKQVEKELGF